MNVDTGELVRLQEQERKRLVCGEFEPIPAELRELLRRSWPAAIAPSLASRPAESCPSGRGCSERRGGSLRRSRADGIGG
ncbi:hypothetical protein [Cohnella cellulosilytica]|uniref:hypothetical protein n=1 Tax=Cohnella cellulosilytica TaxID=986710 RepID=UPI00362423DF